MRCLVGLIILLAMSHAFGERFSASQTIERAIMDEMQMINEFKTLIKKTFDHYHYLNTKLVFWSTAVEQMFRDPEQLVHNPLGTFLKIKRMTADIDLMHSRMYETIDEFNAKIKEIRPSNEELSGAVEGLLRYQAIYLYNSSDIHDGKVDGKKLYDRLSPSDLLTIAREASKLENRGYFAEKYLALATNASANGEDILREVNDEEIQKLSKAIKKQTKDNPFDETYEKTGVYSNRKEAIVLSQACRQKLQKTPAESKALRCRYVSNSPFTKIAPFKMIEADRNSNVVVFLDVLSDNEIKFLKNISRSKFGRVSSKHKGGSIFSNQRAWFSDDEHPIFARISRRVEDMTGLISKTAEKLQVQNYGIAGHYNLHWDISTKRTGPPTLGTGNRIATLLFHLTTVNKGGATIFPYLKVYVPAIKGSATFWFNLKDNGDEDYFTRHAACPVVFGTKWVANKWFHEYGQEFRRPCKPGNYFESTEGDHNKIVY